MAKTVSIPEFLEACFKDSLFSGPLSDHAWSEGGGSEASSKEEAAAAQPQGSSRRKARDKARAKARRKRQKSEVQEALGTSLKLHALLKAPGSSAQGALLTDFDLSADAEVTAPGWLGQQLSSLPSEPYSFQELVGRFKLAPFPWDGK